MKINGIEQVNIRTEENPYWVPSTTHYYKLQGDLDSREPTQPLAVFTVEKGGTTHYFKQTKDETYQQFLRRVDKEMRLL